MIKSHPYLSSLSRDNAPSLGRILSINAMDLESQDHILNYQLPVAIKRYNVGLVVIDSITSNYRAEHTSHDISGLSTRSGELAKLGQMLRNLAASEDIAIVAANQVSDRFEGEEPLNFARVAGQAQNWTPISSPATQQKDNGVDRESAASPMPRVRPPETGNVDLNQHALTVPQSTPNIPSSSPLPAGDEPQPDGSYLVANPVRNEILSLQHQQRFFTGWGDLAQPVGQNSGFQTSAFKTPTLGLVWATQIACRIALKKYTRQAGIDPATDNSAHPTAAPDNGTSKSEPSSASLDGNQTDPPSETAKQPPSQSPEQPIRRTIKLVFSPWAGGPVSLPSEFHDEVEFEIWKGGIGAVQSE